MAGLLIALRDALVVLVLGLLGLALVGFAVDVVLAAYAALVELAHDGRTWLALGTALLLMLALKPGGWRHG